MGGAHQQPQRSPKTERRSFKSAPPREIRIGASTVSIRRPKSIGNDSGIAGPYLNRLDSLVCAVAVATAYEWNAVAATLNPSESAARPLHGVLFRPDLV